MSIYSLSSEAAERLVSSNATARAAGAPSPTATAHATATSVAAAKVDSAIAALVQFIPTESIAVYLAVVAALPALKGEPFWSLLTPLNVYIAFIVFTPILFLLVFYNRLVAENLPFPTFWQIPWWRVTASAIAFAAWALVVPENPMFTDKSAASAAAGLVAIIVSMLLGLVTPIIERLFPPPP